MKDNFIEKYKGTIWKTSGIVIEKRNDSKNENIYIVKYRKFGETCGFTTHSVESNLVDIQIGDVVKVVGCKKENSFELLDIYKSEEYYHIRFAELVIMNAFVIYGGITNFPASSHFGHVAFGFLIWKALVLSILIIINFIGGIVEKNKIGIFFSMVFLGLFIFFQEPKNLRNVIVDLYEGPMVMKDIEVCFSTKESPVRKGDRFSFYTVLYDKFGSKIDEIRIPEDVYESYIPCTSDVVYYKNSGVVVKHRRHGQ